jgi:cytochrome c-type biogenesis protein CcmF
VLALALALVQSIIPLIGARLGDARLMSVGSNTAVAAFAMVSLSFAALTKAHVESDFSVANVFENSHTLKPLIYKFSGVWGNHEGSMLLWVLILTLFAAMVAAFGRNLPPSLKANVLAVQGWIASAFILFILTTSNPFARLIPAPFEGRDLNPVLQDVGLAVHPPMLYLGYVGFSVAFSFAVAALIDGRIDAAWARWVRPWTLAAWMFLTAGIAMGSYWAYYELGWGGFWFWDPVENASFMPWLSGTALLHSAIVMEKRAALKIWTLLLATRHVPRPLRRSDVRAFLCFGPDARRLYPRHPGSVCRRFAGAVRFAGRDAQPRWPVPADLARRRLSVQQSVPHRRRRQRSDRHTLSAGS